MKARPSAIITAAATLARKSWTVEDLSDDEREEWKRLAVASRKELDAMRAELHAVWTVYARMSAEEGRESMDWWTAGNTWLARKAHEEYLAQRIRHIDGGRKPRTFRYVVPTAADSA